MNEPRFDVDLLLAQTGWLRRLARQLVADPNVADDAVQETAATALAGPPLGAESPPVLRAWLRSVLQGEVRGAWRSTARRGERERRDARAEVDEQATADLIVGRAESAQLLVDEVQALAEPHRSTLLLFYFEGLSAVDIAQQLGLPTGTVRTRLSRARDALRERLDSRHGGERRAWMRALIPLAGLPVPASTAASLPSAGRIGDRG